MKRDLSKTIFDLEGKPIRDGMKYKHRDGQPMRDDQGDPIEIAGTGYDFTFKHAFFKAVTAPAQGDDTLSDDEKIKLYLLGIKVSNGGVVDLDTDEAALLKKRVGKVFHSPVLVGRVTDFLKADPPAPPPAAEPEEEAAHHPV